MCNRGGGGGGGWNSWHLLEIWIFKPNHFHNLLWPLLKNKIPWLGAWSTTKKISLGTKRYENFITRCKKCSKILLLGAWSTTKILSLVAWSAYIFLLGTWNIKNILLLGAWSATNILLLVACSASNIFFIGAWNITKNCSCALFLYYVDEAV